MLILPCSGQTGRVMKLCKIKGTNRCVLLLITKFSFLSVEIKLRLYGSSCTKFGFKDSDVNIDIQYPPHVSSPV